jgi:hypothetical protein
LQTDASVPATEEDPLPAPPASAEPVTNAAGAR